MADNNSNEANWEPYPFEVYGCNDPVGFVYAPEKCCLLNTKVIFSIFYIEIY